jgi:hypothetical protein
MVLSTPAQKVCAECAPWTWIMIAFIDYFGRMA